MTPSKKSAAGALTAPNSNGGTSVVSGPGFPLSAPATERLVRAALTEDMAFDDITTSAIVPAERRATGVIVSRESGVIAGLPLTLTAFRVLDPEIALTVATGDGSTVGRAAPVLRISGRATAMLSAERVALNFLQRLSGIATATRKFVDAVAGTGVRIMDTRKTTPGWRALEKYAVRAGGGFNHRMDLGESVLIKDNHIAAVGGDVARAVQRARKMARPSVRVEVECESSDQVEAAIAAGADVVMLDNMPLHAITTCVRIAKGAVIIEASGGVTLNTVRSIAECGVDWISTGSITHSAPALDLALDFD